MSEVKAFAFNISIEEAYTDTYNMVHGKDSGIKKISGLPGFVGVHPDPVLAAFQDCGCHPSLVSQV